MPLGEEDAICPVLKLPVVYVRAPRARVFPWWQGGWIVRWEPQELYAPYISGETAAGQQRRKIPSKVTIKRNLRGDITVDIHASYAHGPRLSQVLREVRGGDGRSREGGWWNKAPCEDSKFLPRVRSPWISPA